MMQQRINNPRFFFFSDDPAFISNSFEDINNKVIIDNDSVNKSVEDLIRMKHCKYHIIANSTYSWWAAFASENSITICPVYRSWKEDFYLEDWIKISV